MKTYSKTPRDSEVSRTVPCPLCGSSRSSHRWTIEGAQFATCLSCGLVFQNPRPVPEDLAVRYDEDYFQYEIENEKAFYDLMMLGLRDADFFESVESGLPEPRRVLDIGCATGRLLSHFKSAGWDTRGVELCGPSARYGNETYGVGIHIGDLESAQFPNGFFSAVHASHLIEHLDDPGSFIEEIYRISVPGGVFVCITPSIDGFQARLHGSRWRSAIPDHVTLFSKKTLKRLLEDRGFSVERIKTWGGLAVGTAPKWLKRPMDRLAKRYGFGDVVLMLARRID